MAWPAAAGRAAAVGFVTGGAGLAGAATGGAVAGVGDARSGEARLRRWLEPHEHELARAIERCGGLYVDLGQ